MTFMQAAGTVVAVSASDRNGSGKTPAPAIRVIEGLGVEGDAHYGATVQHVYLRKRDPNQPNLRQVHLIGAELLDDLAGAGFAVGPGELGENITTRGIALTALSCGTRLHLGPEVVIEVTGLRDPCAFLDRVRPGVRAATSAPFDGKIGMRDAIMGIVIAPGEIRAGDTIGIAVPAGPHRPLPFV